MDKDTNAVCDFILEASDRAKALEKIPEKDRGPLYGIPISVKVSFNNNELDILIFKNNIINFLKHQECFYIGGYDSTVGLAQYVGKPVQEDCSFVAGKLSKKGKNLVLFHCFCRY